MSETTIMRRGIPFDEEDEKILKQLKDELQPRHGSINVTSIIRMSLRALLEAERSK